MENDNSVVSVNHSQEVVKPADDAPAANGERKKLMKLEAIRGFAAIYVICHHSLPKYVVILGHEIAPFRYAQEAVILFFILSGFVIQYAHVVSSDKSFKSFFLKRFLRIFIPLVCVFIAQYIYLLLSGEKMLNSGIGSLIGNLLMLQQVPEVWHQPSWFKTFLDNKPLWSLNFEWWFYMMFFFISYRFGNQSSKVVYIISVIAGISYIFFPFSVNREIMYFIIWWMGADLAKLYLSKEGIRLSAMKKPLIILSVVFVLSVCHFFYYQNLNPSNPVSFILSPFIEVRYFGFSLVILLIAIGWRQLKWIGFNYTIGLFEIFAPISFSLYISHWHFVSFAHYLDNYIGNFYIRVLIYFLICCGFCYFVERIVYPKLSKKILQYFSVKKKSFVLVN